MIRSLIVLAIFSLTASAAFADVSCEAMVGGIGRGPIYKKEMSKLTEWSPTNGMYRLDFKDYRFEVTYNGNQVSAWVMKSDIKFIAKSGNQYVTDASEPILSASFGDADMGTSASIWCKAK